MKKACSLLLLAFGLLLFGTVCGPNDRTTPTPPASTPDGSDEPSAPAPEQA